MRLGLVCVLLASTLVLMGCGSEPPQAPPDAAATEAAREAEVEEAARVVIAVIQSGLVNDLAPSTTIRKEDKGDHWIVVKAKMKDKSLTRTLKVSKETFKVEVVDD